MGKVLSVIPRQIKLFNIENRAHKVISKDKPTPAPKYPTTLQELERIAKEHPEIVKEQTTKDSVLDERLKQVYIVSRDPELPSETNTKKDDTSRPLPLNRQVTEMPEFGYIEPSVIPRGKVTLRQALKFISDHQSDPKSWTIERIADEYLINKESVEKILKYFHTFQVYIPPTKDSKRIIMAESSKDTRRIDKE